MEQVIAFASIGLSLFGPLIVALATSGRGWRRRPLAANVTAQILIAATTVATISLTVWGLHSSLASIGLSTPDWRSPLLAVVLAVPFILAIGPWLMRLPGLLGFQGFERGFAQVNTIPLGALTVGVVVVGTCEEILYRGIGYSLLAEIVGPVLTIILASTAFMIAHIPLWGIGPSLTTGLSEAAFTAFYALSGDLWANVLAHITIDLAGLIYPRLVRGGSGAQES